MTTMSFAAAYPGRVRAAAYALIASALLIAVYFGLLAALSGWSATLGEFRRFWYYVIPLAAGFGVQVGLYARLRQLLKEPTRARTITAASGTTSTAAMLSCCAHYLVNVAPVLGATASSHSLHNIRLNFSGSALPSISPALHTSPTRFARQRGSTAYACCTTSCGGPCLRRAKCGRETRSRFEATTPIGWSWKGSETAPAWIVLRKRRQAENGDHGVEWD